MSIGASAVASSGCASGPVAKDTSGNPEVKSAKEADEKLGVRVRVIGEAKNAKISAAVEGDDWVVYLVEMRQWPDSIEGKQVEATGILGKREDLVATKDPGGGISQGTEKPVHVLREASYIILDD
ncbi:MAG: hypothetical protein U1F43_35720 [Myxococcota bacterium]